METYNLPQRSAQLLQSARSAMPRRSAGLFLVMCAVLGACTADQGSRAPGGSSADGLAALEAAVNELEERFTPGLHQQMVDLQHRHATLWFAGEGENWPLVDYMLHEMEELVEEMEATNPEYDGVQVARLLGEMTVPAMGALEAAMASQDQAAFRAAYDRLTSACNGCHIASQREAIVIQRPTHPPLTNLRFDLQ